MAELKHTIKYRYVCEQCGKQTDWFPLDIEGEKHYGTVIQKAVQDLAENAKARLDKEIRGFKDRAANGNYAYFTAGAACPFCGKPQSWLPAADVTTFSPAKRIALYMCGWLFIGVALTIAARPLADAIPLFEWLAWDGWAILLFVPPFIGMALAIRRNRKNAEINRKQLQSATVKNTPVIDWNGV
jgi:endogenous inhibitor of DNA gyrase (YacG/DUF329 family)